jgi:hypothetical protein
MTEIEYLSIFEITEIAEINSLSLYEYGTSINKYFNEKQDSNFYQQYFGWFEYSQFEKTNTSFIKEFNKSFRDYFLI